VTKYDTTEDQVVGGIILFECLITNFETFATDSTINYNQGEEAKLLDYYTTVTSECFDSYEDDIVYSLTAINSSFLSDCVTIVPTNK